MKDDEVEKILKRYLEYLHSKNSDIADIKIIENDIRTRKRRRRINNIVSIILASLWLLYYAIFDADFVIMAAMAAMITFMVVKTLNI